MTCDFLWEDGWGEHLCHREVLHDSYHRCRCDATRRESKEEQRLRLRAALEALQEDD